jgi:multidrug efflux pump subunit AcrB
MDLPAANRIDLRERIFLDAFTEDSIEALKCLVKGIAICLRHSGATALTFIGFSILSMCLLPLLGQNFFPSVDAGQFDLHVRVRSGTRMRKPLARWT